MPVDDAFKDFNMRPWKEILGDPLPLGLPFAEFEPMPGYDALLNVLHEAYSQAAHGKGAERHANGLPFEAQPMLGIMRMVGPGFGTGQAMKKLQETTGMIARGQDDAAVQELLGAIVYAAATVILVRELRAKAP